MLPSFTKSLSLVPPWGNGINPLEVRRGASTPVPNQDELASPKDEIDSLASSPRSKSSSPSFPSSEREWMLVKPSKPSFTEILKKNIKEIELFLLPINEGVVVEAFSKFKRSVSVEGAFAFVVSNTYVSFVFNQLFPTGKKSEIDEALTEKPALSLPFCEEVAALIERVIHWDYAGRLSGVYTRKFLSQEVNAKLQERYHPPIESLAKIVCSKFEEVERKSGIGIFGATERSTIDKAVRALVNKELSSLLEKGFLTQQTKEIEALITQELNYAVALRVGARYNLFERQWVHEFLEAFPILPPKGYVKDIPLETRLKKLRVIAFETLRQRKNAQTFALVLNDPPTRRRVCMAFSEAVGIWSGCEFTAREAVLSEAFNSLATFFVKIYKREGLQSTGKVFENDLNQLSWQELLSHEVMKKHFNIWIEEEADAYLKMFTQQVAFPLLVNRESTIRNEPARDVEKKFKEEIVGQFTNIVLEFRKKRVALFFKEKLKMVCDTLKGALNLLSEQELPSHKVMQRDFSIWIEAEAEACFNALEREKDFPLWANRASIILNKEVSEVKADFKGEIVNQFTKDVLDFRAKKVAEFLGSSQEEVRP